MSPDVERIFEHWLATNLEVYDKLANHCRRVGHCESAFAIGLDYWAYQVPIWFL